MDTLPMDRNAEDPFRTPLLIGKSCALVLVAALWLPAATASTSTPARAEHAPDADAVALTLLFMQSTVDSVVGMQCDSPKALQAATEIGLDGWLSHDPSLTQDKVRELKSRLRSNGSELSRLCTETLTSAFTSADGPFATTKTAVSKVVDSMEPADRAALLQFLSSRSGTEFARVYEAMGEVVSDAWSKWLSQQGTIVLEQLVRTAVARLPGPSAAAGASPSQSGYLGAESSSSPPPTPPPAPPPADVRVAPARILNYGQLGDACQSFYPVHSRMLGEEGSVIVLVYVAGDGRVTSLQIQDSSGYPALDVATAACIGAAARFSAMQRDGQPVGSWQRLKWNWRLSSPVGAAAPDRPEGATR